MADSAGEAVDPSDELMFLCLGGGNEVGRSCHIIQYQGKTVMLDAGQHPAFDGLAALPYFDEFDLSQVDVLLISHCHLDHASALPYVLAKTNFRGRVFMTHATKAIYKWLIQDSVRVQNVSSSSEQRTTLYTEADHLSTFTQIEAIDYHTTHNVSSIRFTPYPAGHILGAAMFLIEIAGLRLLFTGDYSREEDRHLIPAEIPRNIKIDVLITESTYGIASHVPRVERETALMKSITAILHRGGKVLMPVFALGRAQELLLILDDYWSRHPEYRKIPIYYASNLARKCMVIYQTYISSMNDNIKRMFRERMAEVEANSQLKSSANDEDLRSGNIDTKGGGPWDFRYIRSLKNLDRFDDVGSCVVLASPGMLQSGISRQLLERWAPNEQNGVIMTGYSIEGTMAKQIMHEPDQIPSIMGAKSNTLTRRGLSGESDKPMIPRRCSVQEYSFAAHVDGPDNQDFIETIQAPVVILVHGEKHNMMKLKSKLLTLNHSKVNKTKIYCPANTEEVRIPFKVGKVAKVVGSLAEKPATERDDEERLMKGVLVQTDFKISLMAPEDLREHAGLNTTRVMCKQRLTLNTAGFELIKWALDGTFGAIEELVPSTTSNRSTKTTIDNEVHIKAEKFEDEEKHEKLKTQYPASYMVMGAVAVRYEPLSRELSVEWEGNMLNDGIADAVLAVLFTVESSPAAVKFSSAINSRPHHDHEHAEKEAAAKGEAIQHTRNLHANITTEERLSRLCMFLEAQFGSQVTPIQRPRIDASVLESVKQGLSGARIKKESNGDSHMKEEEDISDEDEEELIASLEAEEIDRLHGLGIPVPGLEIKVDKSVAKVWLDTLDVECASAALRDRVKAVVERAVETIAPLWVGKPRK